MGVDQVAAVIAVARQVQLTDALLGQAADKGPGVEPVVACADIDIVDVQQQLTAAELAQGAEKLPLAELVIGAAQVTRDVFQHQRPLDHVLHLAHPCRYMLQALLGVGQRQQVMQLVGIAPAPTQVIGDPRRPHPRGKVLELAQVVAVEFMRAANRQRHAVHHQRVLLADGIEKVESLATRYQVVFRDDLEPVDGRLLLKNGLVIGTAQAQAKTQIAALSIHR